MAYILASDVSQGGQQFLDDLDKEKAKHVLKSLPIKTRASLWCDHPNFGEIYSIHGAYVFKNPPDAIQIKEWFRNNIPSNIIRYGELYILENSHHWDNPRPDKIIETYEYGSRIQYELAVNTCHGL